MTLTPKQRTDLLDDPSTTFPRLAFDKNAIDRFFEIEDHGRWRGKSALNWLRSVNLRDQIVAETEGDFCSTELDRKALRDYCYPKSASEIESFVAVMAWGEMSIRNGRHALRLKRKVLDLVHEIRDSNSDRAADYERFYEARARKDGSLKGIGPAYYTKLLFFLRPDQKSYILDQWTAKSIHVLTGSCDFPKVQRLQKDQTRVSDAVTPEDYEKYCRILDVIAGHAQPLGWTGSDVEERMFSQGGHEPKPWREYVRRQWPRLAS
jgi:hypothetical protein